MALCSSLSCARAQPIFILFENFHFRCVSVILRRAYRCLFHDCLIHFKLDYLWHITNSTILNMHGEISRGNEENAKIWNGFIWINWEINGIWMEMELAMRWHRNAYLMQRDRHRFTARCQRIAPRCDQHKWCALTKCIRMGFRVGAVCFFFFFFSLSLKFCSSLRKYKIIK